MGRAPTSRARPRDRPPTALKLGSEDSKVSGTYTLKFCRDPCVACESRTRGGGEVLCAKSTFFLVHIRQRTEMTHHCRHCSRLHVR